MKAFRTRNTENQRLRHGYMVTAHLGYLLSFLMAVTSLVSGRGEKGLNLPLLSISLLMVLISFVFKVFPSEESSISRRIFQQLFYYNFLIALAILVTGETSSPLYYLYLLIIVDATLTLHWRMSGIHLILISSFVMTLALRMEGDWYATFQLLVVLLVPFWALTYFASEIFRQLKKDRIQLEQISESDDLTGLYNMRKFSEILEMEMYRSVRYRKPFSLLMLDADNLKSVNDSYGHMTGSRYICNLAGTLIAQLRKTDQIARYGGDEFIVLLPETQVNESVIIAQRICRAVEKGVMEINGTSIHRTVSIGVSCFPDDAINVIDLIRSADAALYECKRRGKNQICSYREIPPPGADA